MLKFAGRMGRAKPSAIMAVAEKAKKLKAAGRDVISFSIGVPNFLPGEHVYQAARDALSKDSGQYGSNRGADALLDAFLKHMEDLGLAGYTRANLSTGIGLQVIQAALLSAEGKTRAQITAAIEEIRPRVRASFTVDTLTYLYRGGRCNAVAALAGTMLKLHPRIVVEDGAMDASKKYRGKLSSVILSYTKDMEDDLKNAVPDRVFITHSGCDREIVESVRSYLESLGIFNEILETRAGGVISSHCGPGTLGVLFIEK